MSDDLDALGFAASKLWNVGRWTVSRVWDEIDYIPEHDELTSYLKTHERYDDLHSQSSQRVLQELAEAFNGWYGKRRNGDTKSNPPGYRKHNDDHPRSTVTFKNKGFKLDTQYQRVRLSQGDNTKDYWSDFILCKYETRPDVDLSTVESVQQVRAVWTGNEWELHIVCKVQIEVSEPPGEKTAGVDLGINNFAALAYEDGYSELFGLTLNHVFQACLQHVDALLELVDVILLFEVDAHQDGRELVRMVQVTGGVSVLASVGEQPVKQRLVTTSQRSPKVTPLVFHPPEQITERRVRASHAHHPSGVTGDVVDVDEAVGTSPAVSTGASTARARCWRISRQNASVVWSHPSPVW